MAIKINNQQNGGKQRVRSWEKYGKLWSKRRWREWEVGWRLTLHVEHVARVGRMQWWIVGSGEWRLIWQLLSSSFREEETQKVGELCTRPEIACRYITNDRVDILPMIGWWWTNNKDMKWLWHQADAWSRISRGVELCRQRTDVWATMSRGVELYCHRSDVSKDNKPTSL